MVAGLTTSKHKCFAESKELQLMQLLVLIS